jgi:hypothetical protein
MTRPTSSVRVRRIAYYKLSQPLTAVTYDNDRDGIEQDVLDVVQNDDPKLVVDLYYSDPSGFGKLADEPI